MAAAARKRRESKQQAKADAGHFDMLGGGLRPKRWLPEMKDVNRAGVLLQLRAHGQKQWSAHVMRGPSMPVTEKAATLFLAWGSNMTRRCIFMLAFDQGHDELPHQDDRAVHGVGPVGPLAPWNLDMPRGSRPFKFGILLVPSTDPTFFRAVPGADATYQYEYLEVS